MLLRSLRSHRPRRDQLSQPLTQDEAAQQILPTPESATDEQGPLAPGLHLANKEEKQEASTASRSLALRELATTGGENRLSEQQQLTSAEAGHYKEQTAKAVTALRSPWLAAIQQVLPIYSATHLLYLLLSYVAFLFPGDSSSTSGPVLRAMINSWRHWDTGHFITIALHGYSDWWRTAFFPLYPLLIRLVNYLADNPVLAGLVVSNLAGFGVLVLLYRLVTEDFDDELANRTVLYYAMFPMAFFLAAAYSESLFMLLSLLCFYSTRRGRWWQAALWGGQTSLTRATAIPLLIPFVYEYLRQHHFRLREFRFDVLSILGIPSGLALLAGYCYLRFHDPLAFSHAESVWQRSLQPPWLAFSATITALVQDSSHLDFITIHRVIDLTLLTAVLALVVLLFVGPWRLRGPLAPTYTLYTVGAFIFFLLVPAVGRYPTMSMPRFALALFPAFIVLARLGGSESFRLHYLIISGGLLTFSVLQFLIGQWAG